MERRGKLVDFVQDSIIDLVFAQEDEFGNANGEHIFNENELAERFGVSRSTIREAVRSLEVRGFVERIHGVGVKLTNKSLHVVTRSLEDMIKRDGVKFNELLEIRRIIEVQAAELAALRATDEFDVMEKAVAIMENRHVTYNEYVEADFMFHNQVVIATKNKTLCALVKSYEFIFKDLILASTSSEYRPEISGSYHKKIMKHIKNKDPEGAGLAMMEHLNATETNIYSLHKSK